MAVREVPASEAGPITPQPPRGSRRPNRRIAQVPTLDPALLETQNALLTQAPSLELTAAAALTQAQVPGLEETQSAVLTQVQVPGLEETQTAVFEQLPGLQLTAAAAEEFGPGWEETQAAILTPGLIPGLDLTQTAVFAQVPGLDLTQTAVLELVPGFDLTQTAVFEQVPGLELTLTVALTPGANPGTPSGLSPDGNSLTLSAPPLTNVNERWNATTFGIGASIVIIVLGNLVAGLRLLLRRNR